MEVKSDIAVKGPFEDQGLNKAFQSLYDGILSSKKAATAAIGFTNAKTGKLTLYTSMACHSSMSSESVRKASLLGVLLPGSAEVMAKPEAQHLANFLYNDEKSPYAPIIDYLGRGKGFHLVRDKDGKIRGFIISNNNLSMKLVMNLTKSSRCFHEHVYVIDTWKKWVIEKGYPACGLTFVMCFFYTSTGTKRHPSHSPVEGQVKETLNLRRLLGRWGPKEWEFEKDPMKSTGSYIGENTYMWCYDPTSKTSAGKFNIHQHIRKAGARLKVKTIFYKKYFEKTPDQLSELDIKTFIEEALAGKYDEFL